MVSSAPGRDSVQVMRRRGVFVLTVFALVWAAAGLSGIEDGALALTAGLVVVALAVSAIVLAVRRGAGSGPARPPPMPADWSRQFVLVNVLQAVGIGLSIVALVVVGAPEAIPPTVCLVVGLHFFPLARIFGYPLYTWTGEALCIVAAAGFAAVAIADGETARVVVGLGAAASLLVAALQLATGIGHRAA